MRRGIKTPTAVTTAILTVITIFFWIAFEIYRSLTTKPAPPVPPEIVVPLNPTLDVATLNKLQQRMHLSDDQIGNFTVSSPNLAPPVVSSPSATIPPATESATPTGTSSAVPTTP